MFRIPAVTNQMRSMTTAFLKYGPRFVRPITTSAIRLAEEASKRQNDNNVESLFDAESSQRTDAQKQDRRGGRGLACINRIELLGGVADSPVERTTRNGNPYLSFNMFTNVEFRKPDGTFDENVELHNIIVFGNLINYARKNVQKGSRIIATGRLHYTTAGNAIGNRVPRTASIVADLVQVIAKPVSRDQGYDS